MLEQLLELRSPLSEVLNELGWENLALSEWRLMECICNLLKPFAVYICIIIFFLQMLHIMDVMLDKRALRVLQYNARIFLKVHLYKRKCAYHIKYGVLQWCQLAHQSYGCSQHTL